MKKIQINLQYHWSCLIEKTSIPWSSSKQTVKNSNCKNRSQFLHLGMIVIWICYTCERSFSKEGNHTANICVLGLWQTQLLSSNSQWIQHTALACSWSRSRDEECCSPSLWWDELIQFLAAWTIRRWYLNQSFQGCNTELWLLWQEPFGKWSWLLKNDQLII